MLTRWKAYYLMIGFLCFVYSTVFAQDQKVADSLAVIYNSNILDDTAKLELLRNLSFNEVKNLNLSLKYAEELISLSIKAGNNLYLHRGYLQKGNKKRLLGDLDEALDIYFKSAEAAQKVNYSQGEGIAYSAIADIYSISKNHRNAMLYYHKAINTLRYSQDSVALASIILNAGEEFINNENYDSARLYFDESKTIFEKVNYLIGEAYSIGNIGMVYAHLGQNDLAEQNIKEAIAVLEQLDDYYPICVYLISMCDIYLEKGDERTAMNYAKRSLELAEQHGLKEQISDANRKLAELYERDGDMAESYRYFKNYITYRDSVNNIQGVQKMAELRTNYEISQKQIEVDLLTQQKRNQKIIAYATAIALFLICLLALGLYKRYKFIQATNKIIEEEKNRSETLLLNILPAETADELKINGKIQAKKFDSATVLFTDFKEFTKYSELVEPERLVQSIDFYFKAFDEITSRYHLEKIKTIGDSYMCAGGLPTKNESHARDVIRAAKDMIDFVGKELKVKDDVIHFEIRIGVHTGPVIAGVVGIKKWQYDIWGDTVNIASRMESMSEPGRINLSEWTFNEIKDEFPCEYRGELEVKNRGSLKMYYLS